MNRNLLQAASLTILQPYEFWRFELLMNYSTSRCMNIPNLVARKVTNSQISKNAIGLELGFRVYLGLQAFRAHGSCRNVFRV